MIYPSLQLVEEHFVTPVVPSAVPPTRPFIPCIAHAILPSAGFLISACLLWMAIPASTASAQSGQTHRHTKSHRANAAPAEHVTYSDGQLSVQSNGADLAVVLSAIQQATGVKISGVAAAQKQKLVGDFGPGDPASVLAEVLDGTRLNYIFLKSHANPSVIRSVMLFAQSAPPAQPPPAPAAAPSATQRTSPTPPPENAPQRRSRYPQTGEGSPAAEPAPAESAPAEPAPKAQQPPENSPPDDAQSPESDQPRASH
jgi:hypothetical protein